MKNKCECIHPNSRYDFYYDGIVAYCKCGWSMYFKFEKTMSIQYIK